ncbi:cytochrome c-binding protein [Bacteroidia bacterium]|nr:cytochrome c-binding protein [Bacteroidia bacterium]GHV70222.1 cytochrome c-binding protein [Bacteroidia bacterium]
MKHKIFHIVTCLLGIFLFAACSKQDDIQSSDEWPSIYPDYTNVTIPSNIAPLNFIMREEPEQTEVVLKGAASQLTSMGSHKIQFSEKHWKKFLQTEQGNTVNIQIKAKIHGKWIKYKSFYWNIVEDRIDPYLTYRLIEPGYEVWNKIQLKERNIENFKERIIADNNLTGGTCMNCHITGNQNPLLSFFHIRGENGGTILNRNGQLRKINTRNKDMFASATYGNLHPSGKYGVFSTNIVVPDFHTKAGEKLEVYDTASDLVILDFDNNRIIRSDIVGGTDFLETFPTFSADGNSIFFCVAPNKTLPDSIKNLKYSLCKIGFDVRTGQFGTQIDTLIYMDENGKSVSFPKPSPDGRFLLYSVSDYGTFPIWHRETDLQMLNLKTGEILDLPEVNSNYSDTYHSWSSNSRWFVFASKRDDGLYGKPYFCYVDRKGNAHKPFVLPQRDPYYYDYLLKSFNIPELSTGKLPFNAADIEKVYWKDKIEQFE